MFVLHSDAFELFSVYLCTHIVTIQLNGFVSYWNDSNFLSRSQYHEVAQAFVVVDALRVVFY